jgi:hypothetical protein
VQTADQIIKEMIEAGQPAGAIQARLREGFDPTNIPIQIIIQSLALNQEELLSVTVKLFAEAVKLVGAEIDADGMFNAYLESLRLAQDAFFYDAMNRVEPVEAEIVDSPHPVEIEGQVDIDEAIADATGAVAVKTEVTATDVLIPSEEE